ncbi:hypothetical protein K461DRAFT_309019 [Myriangium duriaei CBS 260.36]|uniref:Zn(2)-C6 fungal-type domain-containing protein n=1 Tax=Myriangium duriaei CBS 260.36 TaxID=1168546 RepID=A0A9P4J8J0_9PEZI|nr:hypothetical protein K461DRAFT_309019 [Myriangium duriaei CBS 260.36]
MEGTPQAGPTQEFVAHDDRTLTWPMPLDDLEPGIVCSGDLADLYLNQHPAITGGTDLQSQTNHYFYDVPIDYLPVQPSRDCLSREVVSWRSSGPEASDPTQFSAAGPVEALAKHATTNDRDNALPLPETRFADNRQDHTYLDQGNTLLRTTLAKSRSSKKSGVTKLQRGGRYQPLTRQQRKSAGDMRKAGACWCCAIQRDKCDHNEPCERCRQKWLRASSSPLTILRCDRRPLVQLLDLVIPPSLCRSTTRSEALEFVSVRIRCWLDVSVVVPLSFSYGPLIDWIVMREFKLHAAFDGFRYELLYDTSETDVSLQTMPKKSPCLALTQINEEDHAKFNKFIDDIIEQDLDKFVVECFENEHQFQTDLLRLLSHLYHRLHNSLDTDKRFKSALHNILRMLIVTNMMCIPLKIPEVSMPSVISQLQSDNRLEEYAPQASSRIASFQIKYYLSHIRSETYAAILKTLHTIYRTGEQKEKTWLIALCCTLGLSMVLEECQHLLNIQWDSRIVKEGVDPFIAKKMTLSDCGLIDEQFAFLVQLFNVKYSRKNVRYPSYRDYLTGCEAEGPEHAFIVGLRGLMQDNAECLKTRVNLILSPDNERQWTSRLVAKFLDHFMELDLGSQI